MSQLGTDVGQCSDSSVEQLIKGVTVQLWRSNALMVTNAVLVAVMVAVGASGRRYRHKAVTRFLLQGASTLYLPIVSYVASSIGTESCSTSGLDVFCHGRSYVAFLLIWTVLVQIVGTSTSFIVAADDDDDDGGAQKYSPSIQLLARMVWTSYLVFYYANRGFLTIISNSYTLDAMSYYEALSHLLVVLCLLSLAKIVLKLYAFHKARRSFALGRNSRLIAGYMERLLQGSGSDHHHHPSMMNPPPLIVMGEDKQEIEKTPQGYNIKQQRNPSSLVTLDVVWQMASSGDDALLQPRPWLKDLCLSFALSKLLRRRFAKAHIAESGNAKAFSFVLDVLLNNGSPDWVFSVIGDEISFVVDTYYSSLPTSYFGRLLPILNIVVSISIMAWCLVGGAYISHHFSVSSHPNQIFCRTNPDSCQIPPKFLNDGGVRIEFGNILFNAVPTTFLVVAVVTAEAWEIVSYLCSNWMKVTMLCSYVAADACWRRSFLVHQWLGLVMKLKSKRSRWRDHMGQRSLLASAHAKQPCSSTGRLLFCFSDNDPMVMRHIRVPSEVKAAIVAAIRDSNGALSKGTAALQKSGTIGGGNFLWACQGQGTSDVILTWHIATGILEARHASSSTTNKGRAVATHLSRYCAYLVAAAPELLPDDKAWSKKLYKTVSRDIQCALECGDHDDGMAMTAHLGGRSDHEAEVIRRGVTLGKQLMELIADEEARWGLLASFWSEILLHVAPSDNLKAHKKAIARDAELLTLVWALLSHAGIITRPSIRNNVVC